jgi:chromosome segregation ATPase
MLQAQAREKETKEELVDAVHELDAAHRRVSELEVALEGGKQHWHERELELERNLREESALRDDAVKRQNDTLAMSKQQMSRLQEEYDAYCKEQEELQSEYVRQIEELRERLEQERLNSSSLQGSERKRVAPPPHSPDKKESRADKERDALVESAQHHERVIAMLTERIEQLQESLQGQAEEQGTSRSLKGRIEGLETQLREAHNLVEGRSKEAAQLVRDKEELESVGRRLRSELTETVSELSRVSQRAEEAERARDEVRQSATCLLGETLDKYLLVSSDDPLDNLLVSSDDSLDFQKNHTPWPTTHRSALRETCQIDVGADTRVMQLGRSNRRCDLSCRLLPTRSEGMTERFERGRNLCRQRSMEQPRTRSRGLQNKSRP